MRSCSRTPRDLVDGAAVRRRPGPPLHAVHRAEVTVRRRPLVPDRHAVLLQPADVAVAAQEPQQLVGDRPEVHPLGRDQREALPQVEAQLVPEDAARAGAGAVGTARPGLQHVAEQVFVRRLDDGGCGHPPIVGRTGATFRQPGRVLCGGRPTPHLLPAGRAGTEEMTMSYVMHPPSRQPGPRPVRGLPPSLLPSPRLRPTPGRSTKAAIEHAERQTVTPTHPNKAQIERAREHHGPPGGAAGHPVVDRLVRRPRRDGLAARPQRRTRRARDRGCRRRVPSGRPPRRGRRVLSRFGAPSRSREGHGGVNRTRGQGVP